MPENEKKFQDMFNELSQYEQRGVSIVMEGKPASPTQIVKAHMVKEDQTYMRDYVLNEEGDVKALYFYSIE